MASFLDRGGGGGGGGGTSSSTPPPPPPPPPLAPKPIASLAPALAFSQGDGGHGGDEEEDEEEEEGDEEDYDGIDTTDLDNCNGYAAASSSSAYQNQNQNQNALLSVPRAFHLDASADAFTAQDPSAYWRLLRSHFSDPLTGALMDDALILSCGHSYGTSGMQQLLLMKSCCKCSHPVAEDLVRPNFALRSAVQAFRREEERYLWKVSKQKRDQLEQEKCGYDDTISNDFLRNRASLFPLAISDRVIIKGNKRTPPRFVGRVAVVTAQCLNGWYVVKTLDNGESIKLQFGSLAKVSSDQPTGTGVVHTKANCPNWL